MSFLTVCRVCIQSHREMLNIFESYSFAERNCEIFKVITDCASVQIQKFDGFSQKICWRCLEHLSQAYSFKKLCEDSDYKFRNNLTATNENVIKSELPEKDTEIHNESKSKTIDYGVIEVKQEFPEENTVINYGETRSDFYENSDEKNKMGDFDLIAVKTEQCDSETRTRTKDPNEKEELNAIKPSCSNATYNCAFCIGKFTNGSNLSAHVKLQHAEKSFDCDKNFKQSSNMSHVIFHMGEKRFQCDICGKQFTEGGSLKAHTRLHTGEKRFKCEFCDKKFTQSGHLVTHVRTHTGEKRFNCDFCDKKFRNSSNLAVHVRLHTGEKRYQCNFCDKKFRQSSHLASHVAVHTGDRQYECDICGKKYAQSGSLVTHKRGHVEKTNFFDNSSQFNS